MVGKVSGSDPLASTDVQDYPLDGTVGDVRIWNRALSESEIASEYNHLLTGNESGLVAYYNFEDGTGSTTLTDLSPNGYDGTLMNMDPSNDWTTSGASIGAYTLANSVTGTSDASGIYQKGETEVVWTATDANGNSSSCTSTVTVEDNTPRLQ